MSDTVQQAPAQKQTPLTLSFLYASKGEGPPILRKLGEPVLKQLGEEESYAGVFPAVTAEIIRAYHEGSLKKEDYATLDDFIDQVIKPVLEAFLNVTCPSAKCQPQTAQWVFKQYLSHRQEGLPLKAEDLHKIGENIAYFDKIKKSDPFKQSDPKPSSDLMTYTYAAFEEMLTPYLAPYLERKAKSMAVVDGFSMSPQEKAQVTAETTMLYDGPLGQVVVVQTPEASNYWGRNTKWCINSERWRNYRINFPHYNKISPIIMLIPKGRHDDKVLLLDKTFFNSRNKKIATLEQPHHDLLQSCLAGLSEGTRKGIEPWIPKEATALGGHAFKDAYAVRKLRNCFYFVASMKGDVRHPTKKKAWQPDNARLTAHKMKALERKAEKGDMKKFVQHSRRYKSTWSDAETFFAADPAATIEKIKNETAARPSRLAKIPLLRALRR